MAALFSNENLEKVSLQLKWENQFQFDYVVIVEVLTIVLLLMTIILALYLKEKRLNKIIKDEKKKFENIFYKATDGTSILTNGMVTNCNDALVKLLGYSNQKELFNLAPSDLSPEYQPDGEKSLDKSILMMKIAKEEGSNYFEWKHIKANGEEFWTEIALTNISIHENETIIHVIWRDINRRKELENDLTEINIYLEEKVEKELEKNRQHELAILQQSRHAQMGEMISMIAHQWRQPLNNLSMIIQGGALKYKLGKFNDSMMDKLSVDSQKQIMQMSQTIDDFRYFFKVNKHSKIFSVNTSVLHVITLLKPIYEQELIEIKTNFEEDISIKGFSNELGQVLINILNNAKDVLVENNRNEKKRVEITLKKENNNVVITVEDNAGGIDNEIIDKIFDPYFSTKEEKNGTGLGLYMSKSIVEEYCKGTLSVKNGKNGAIFKIILDGNIDE